MPGGFGVWPPRATKLLVSSSTALAAMSGHCSGDSGSPPGCVCQDWATGSKDAFGFHTPGTCLWEEKSSSSRPGTESQLKTSIAVGGRAARWARPLPSYICFYPLATCCDGKIVGVKLCEN